MQKILPFTMQETVAVLVLEDLQKLPVKKHLKTRKKKNLPWVLVRLQAHARQKGNGWTCFNISVRNKVEVRQGIVGYLPTINAPTTVHEVLVRSVKIKDALQLKCIVVMLDH